jgi:S-adenosylmethionine:tRNA ribosyltransferase-isomerase
VKLADFDYPLPPERIAQQPAPERAGARLMVLDRKTGAIGHEVFAKVGRCLEAGDLLVLNETKVLPARLIGKKQTGGRIEVLLVRREREKVSKTGADPGCAHEEWACLAQSKGRLRPGAVAAFAEGLCGEFRGRTADGLWRLSLRGEGGIEEKRRRAGFAPLPPYIHRTGDETMRSRDLERYQTVYARNEGAIAAPTAGLHFTESLLNELQGKGVEVRPVTLHVGVGTFLPVRTEEIEDHRLEPEVFEVPAETAEAVNRARSSQRRVVAVGTTVTRALESCADESGAVKPRRGETGLFIAPGHTFRAVDALVTNFHLPRSTLLMLVAAFAGKDLILRAYEEAVRAEYRFYSYGDAMLIV